MFSDILLIILPIFIGGLTSIVVLKKGWLQSFRKPLDFNTTFHGNRIFGDNKTFLVPLIMTISVFIVGSLLTFLLKRNDITIFAYAVVGLFYSLGELPNSFIKRQLAIAPGDHANEGNKRIIFDVLDNIDSLLFCGIAYILFFNFKPFYLLTALILGSILHFSTDALMRAMKIKK